MLLTKPAEMYVENFDAVSDVLYRNGILKLNEGIEVGVRSGVFSHFLLTGDARLRMHLVDPYLPYIDTDGTEYTLGMQQAIQASAHHRLRLFEQAGRAHWYAEPSPDATQNFRPESVDFVFIDANHEADAVRADLEAWFPIVRPGGILCGHDFHMRSVSDSVSAFMCRDITAPIGYIAWPADVWMIEKR